jgi:transposase
MILAAGSASRLPVGGGPKPLVPVLGLPLLERTIVTAYEAALSKFLRGDRLPSPAREAFLSHVLIAECGLDMSVFPTVRHFASWAGACPDQHQSAGRRKTGRARPRGGAR